MAWGIRWTAPLAILLFSPRVAVAHDVGGTKFAAPLPLEIVFLGAALTVGLTAVWLAVSRRTTSTQQEQRILVRIPHGPARLIGSLSRLLFLAAVTLALVVGITGRQVAAENFATLFTWPVWFRGVAVVAILVGTPWALLSPWRTIYQALTRLEGDPIRLLGEYPDWLAEWPAVAGFVVLFGLVDNLTTVPLSPRLTTATLALYAMVMIAGALMFGSTWLRRADPLHVFYHVLARTASIQFERTQDRDYTISVRPPWSGCLRPAETLAVVVFVIVMLYTVSFDGFANTAVFNRMLEQLRMVLDVGGGISLIVYTTGLGIFLGSVGIAAWFIEYAARESGGGWRGALRGFAPTLVPIAAAYELAHNYPYILENLAQILSQAARLVGPDDAAIHLTGWLSLPVFWGSQVVLIVLGHVVAVIAAHYVAMDRYEEMATARRGHLPLVVLMVGYTVLSLWIISQPVVQ